MDAWPLETVTVLIVGAPGTTSARHIYSLLYTLDSNPISLQIKL